MLEIDDLPDWLDVDSKAGNGEALTALEDFIWEYEPQGTAMVVAFRKRLVDMLNEHAEKSQQTRGDT